MKNQQSKLLVHIIGPTAIGKTATSIQLAQKFNSEIISADSRQFYKELNIGTAKPSADDLKSVNHHFINSLSIVQDYNVSDYEIEAIKVIEELFEKHDVLFVVGGSGLYLHAIWHGFDANLPGQNKELRKELDQIFEEKGIEGLMDRLNNLDPEAQSLIDVKNPIRIMRAIEIVNESNKPLSSYQKNKTRIRNFDQLKIGLNIERELLYDRINKRVNQMIEQGLEKEAQELIPFKAKNALKTVGYQELFRYFAGNFSKEEGIEKIKVNSRRYAKRQLTWYRRYDDIEWFDPQDIEGIAKRIHTKLENK